ALHLAGTRLCDEGEREPLQMTVDGRAHVVHHALADLSREVRLDHAEDAGDDRDRDRDADECARQPQPTLRDRGVEELLDHERRDDAEPGGEYDQRSDDAELPPVRSEEPADAAQVRTADGRVRRTDDGLARCEGVTRAW